MPHGTPDWGLVGPKQTTYGLDDLGEHAARLGSPHLWDRRGDVVHQTDFSEGLGIYNVFFWGAPAYGCLYTHRARHGAFCVKLVTDGDKDHPTALVARIPIPRICGIGLEFTFSTRSTDLYWRWELTWYLGVDRYEARVRWDLVNNRLEYYAGVPVWPIFATDVYWVDITTLSNTGKMVIDTVKWEYSRFLLNDATFDMRGIAVDHSLGPPTNHFEVGLGFYGADTIEAEGYVDSVIITQNEP